jgi:hypothetical protein
VRLAEHDGIAERACYRGRMATIAWSPLLAALLCAGCTRGARPASLRGELVNEVGDRAVVEARELGGGQRAYLHRTTQRLRDDEPRGRSLRYEELPGQPLLRSGNLLFDALFALAIHEARETSVSEIRDSQFAGGAAIPCACFETGRKWRYVWTRDTSYSVHLALGLLDPERSRRSLAFKLSRRRAGTGGEEIVQDTGTGGSWPVSTDRVVWALGARETLEHLRGAARRRFRRRAYEALRNTVESDRRTAFDPRDGLYRGEQSFLDWREQSYASWTARDTVHIAMSKALSTNVAHQLALSTTADLARREGERARARRYARWAAELRAAINRVFWREGSGYSAMTATELDGTPEPRLDLLGTSLAVLAGVAGPRRGRLALARYPNTDVGAPVVWPQQQEPPIYHNRAVWPFVTAYALRAAARVGHAAFFEHNLRTLMRAAALNLSNMENLEYLTGRPFVSDGPRSGPVINSRRQLWSVAGYLSAVIDGVFGLRIERGALTLRPFVTCAMRRGLFGASDVLRLRGLRPGGRAVDVALRLPARSRCAGVLEVAEVRRDGRPASGPIALGGRGGRVAVEVVLRPPRRPGPRAGLRRIRVASPLRPTAAERRALLAPREPAIEALRPGPAGVKLRLTRRGERGTVFDLFRDGRLLAAGIGASEWTDRERPPADRGRCYALAQRYPETGNTSHHSRPRCLWPGRARQEIPVTDPRVRIRVTRAGRWGAPDDRLELTGLTPGRTGGHLISLRYSNAHHAVNLGVTAATKRVEVSDEATGALVAKGTVTMPHLPDWSARGQSTRLPVALVAGRSYAVRVLDHYNMSYLEHFVRYTAGAGGRAGPENTVDLWAMVLEAHERR